MEEGLVIGWSDEEKLVEEEREEVDCIEYSKTKKKNNDCYKRRERKAGLVRIG